MRPPPTSGPRIEKTVNPYGAAWNAGLLFSASVASPPYMALSTTTT